ncbi:MFS transporter [Microbacterium sp. F51-2R]|uniref:MFS transporter n=1 Tax=Microbacterium sp. F51-2R TaxID=3445777 RepID=UPI003F9F66A1
MPEDVVTAPPRARERLPLVVWMLGLVTFVMGTTEMIVAGLLPSVAASLDVTLPQAGLLITVYALGMVVGTPIMAVLTLRLPRKATLILALVLFAVAHIVAAATDSFAIVLIARFAAALATGTFWAIGAVVAAAAAGAAAGARAMGVMVGGVTLATVLGVPIGTAFGQFLGWQGPFWILAVLALACAALMWRALPGGMAASGANDDLSTELRRLRSGRLWTIYALTALVQAAFLGVYSFISPQLTGRAGLEDAAVPLVMIAYGIGALTGTTLGGRLGDRRPYTVITSSVIGLALVMLVLFVWGDILPVAVMSFTLMGLFGFAANPIFVSEALRTAGPDGVLPVALSNSFFNVGIAVGSALCGYALATPLAEQGVPLAGFVLTIAAALPAGILASTAGKRRTP